MRRYELWLINGTLKSLAPAALCAKTIEDRVRGIACPSCDVSVLDMQDPKIAARAKGLGIQAVPAVVINGKIADCCQERDFSEAALRAEGIGQPIA